MATHSKEVLKYLNVLINNKFTVDEMVILFLVTHKDYKSLESFVEYHYFPNLSLYRTTIEKLQKEGWLKIMGEDYIESLEIRSKFTSLFGDSVLDERLKDVDSWIQDFRNIFKVGKPGAMGDPNACLDKMKKFIKAHPQYTKEQIMKAAEVYVNSQAPAYRFLQQADYFISKQSVDKGITSRLLSFLEDPQTTEDYNESYVKSI